MAWTPQTSTTNTSPSNYIIFITDSFGNNVWTSSSLLNWDDVSLSQILSCLQQTPMVVSNSLTVSLQKLETTITNNTSTWS